MNIHLSSTIAGLTQWLEEWLVDVGYQTFVHFGLITSAKP
jgi:hypothetical protein